jgi:hypothetical protein
MAADWKEKVTLTHYTGVFAGLDPVDAAARCGFGWNAKERMFAFRFMGEEYTVAFPGAAVSPDTLTVNEKILALRCLCAGTLAPYRGKSLSYREIPWGDLYFKVFEGRCVLRLARSFDGKCAELARVLESAAGLRAARLSDDHFAYRFEFISNLSMSFHIWPADDEFPASAQILFDDNVPPMFSAEDLAILCEAVIGRLSRAAAAST